MYCALTVDLKDSRRYPPERRNELQSFLIEAAETLTGIFRPALARELSFSGGDELQALFTGPEAAFLCLRLLRRVLFPIPLHAGLGVGEWTTVVPERSTFYQDGTAFHRARAALEQAKRETDYTALLDTGGEGDARLNAVMNAAFLLAEQNTSRQNELALLLEYLYPILPRQEAFDLSPLWGLMRARAGLALFAGEKGIGRQSVFAGKRPESFAAPVMGLTSWSGMRRCYHDAHPYGAASAAAEAAGLTRQAVDTALRASKVYAERALALTLRDGLAEL